MHQLALADFIAEGHFERNINRLRTLYRKKQEILKEAITEVFEDRIEVSGDGAGLHLLLEIDTDAPPEVLIEKAASIDIKLYPVESYYADPSTAPPCQIMFGFPTVPEDKFKIILDELKRVWGI